jgi:hypothetical protein
LLQVFFFGLVLYVLAQTAQIKSEKARKQEAAQIEKIKDAAGISNLTELTDLLTNLGPIDEFKGTADFISEAGGKERIRAAVKVAEQAGGAENIGPKLDKLRKLEEGAGKPPCLFNTIGDKKVAKPLGTVVASDTSISFRGVILIWRTRYGSSDEVMSRFANFQ